MCTLKMGVLKTLGSKQLKCFKNGASNPFTMNAYKNQILGFSNTPFLVVPPALVTHKIGTGRQTPREAGAGLQLLTIRSRPFQMSITPGFTVLEWVAMEWYPGS
jgi:hypothetical protein